MIHPTCYNVVTRLREANLRNLENTNRNESEELPMLFLKVYDTKEQDWEWDEDDYFSIIPEECRWANWAHDDKSDKAMTGDDLLNFVNNTLFPTLKKLPVDATTPIRKAIVQTTFADANNYMKDEYSMMAEKLIAA